MPYKVTITVSLYSITDNSLKYSEQFPFEVLWGFRILEKFDTINLNRKHNSKVIQIQSGVDLDIKDEDNRPDISLSSIMRKEFDEDINIVYINLTIPHQETRKYEKKLAVENILTGQKEILTLSYDPEGTYTTAPGWHLSTSDYIVLTVLGVVVCTLIYTLRSNTPAQSSFGYGSGSVYGGGGPQIAGTGFIPQRNPGNPNPNFFGNDFNGTPRQRPMGGQDKRFGPTNVYGASVSYNAPNQFSS